MALNVQDIHAHWLQWKISQAYGQNIDSQKGKELAEAILPILTEGDDLEVENKLVVLLGCDNIDLIKYLMCNRLKVVWCTRLARAEDEQRRKEIEEAMMELGPDHAVTYY